MSEAITDGSPGDKHDGDNFKEKEMRFPFTVDFITEPSEYFKVKWAKRNDCLVFLDEDEMFVVDIMMDGCHRKRKLRQMKGKIVHHMEEDPDGSGFYIICSQEYDSRLELEHSHRDELKLDFERQVEPGIIKIFNMAISTTKKADELNTKEINMRFVGMRDDEFTFDRC